MLKKLLIYIFLFTSVYGNNLENVFFVENKDNEDQTSLIKEFFNENTNYYTVSVAVLTASKHSPIEFFKRNKLTNAVAYKFGKNLEYIRVISGVYTSSREANEAINNLNRSILKNNPYAIKIKRHQNQFKMYNVNSSLPIINENTTIKTQSDKEDSIYISGSKNSINLKNEILKKENSKLYAISVATIPSSNKTIKNYFKYNGISDKALAHVYGKKRDKVRVVYGLYDSFDEAKNAIRELNRNLKKNNPYPMKMKHFQSFYRKNNRNDTNQDTIQLKVNDKKIEEKVTSFTLNDEIKIIKPKEPTKIKVVKTEKELTKTKKLRKAVHKKAKPKVIVKKIKNDVKSEVVKKRDLNENRYLKHSEIEDVYYVESKGEFNILNEVFLNDGSSFYTIDLGEIKLAEQSIEDSFLEKNIANNALSYKYGKDKEYARLIYGAYETEARAKNAIEELNLEDDNLMVSNIKKHQKLFKTYHENILKRTNSISSKKVDVDNKIIGNLIKPSIDDIIYIEFKDNYSLKDEFFKKSSSFFTITLITFNKKDSSPESFISNNYLEKDLLAFSLGSNNDYYRVIYGVFKSKNEALNAIEKLDVNLLKNKPYISRIRTSKKRFESYNDRKISDYKNLATEIELK